MYHYTYIIKYTTGMYYLGCRSSKVPPEQDTKYKGYTYTKEEADRIYAKKDKYQMKFHWINHYTGEKEHLTCRDFSDKYIDSPNRLMIINNVINARPRQRNRGGILYRNWKGWYLDPAYLLSYKTA